MAFLLVARFLAAGTLFDVPYSTVLTDRDGELLGARIAADGQWRFPEPEALPEKYVASVLVFEDKRFRYHPGVDPLALSRAITQNVQQGRVVSGASTITMQLVRLSRENPARTPMEKAAEIFRAIGLELKYNKDEILLLYAAHSPFGGNVVGIEAASWRYFARDIHELSWSESALLAVLPNSPSLIHPGRNREMLLQKRNGLLHRLHKAGHLDEMDLELALLEQIPEAPHPLPTLSPHVLDRAWSSSRLRGKRITTTINYRLQDRLNTVIGRHYSRLVQNDIHHAAALVICVRTGEIKAYTGNTTSFEPARGHAVDLVQAERSSGSILKPLLYALMLDDGQILPGTLIPDVPTQISGYMPQNFSRTYSGAVPAGEVVSRSLNVPSVRMLREYGLERFHFQLNEMGLTTIKKPADHYGLTLILGGAETRLLEMGGLYARMANQLGKHFELSDASSDPEFGLRLWSEPYPSFLWESSGRLPGNGSLWVMFNAMQEVTRPDGEVDWRRFDSARRIGWKTGTSFGHRDAWAIGVTPEYVVAVWVGNADGEGRAGLTGASVAGPVMFDIFHQLPETSWFSEPVYETEQVVICTKSGHRAGSDCEKTHLVSIPAKGLQTGLCPYHSVIFTDRETRSKRVSSRCSSPENMQAEQLFRLPPAMAAYYRTVNTGYRELPGWAQGCEETGNTQPMEMVYPPANAEIYIPLEADGQKGRAVFELAHESSGAEVFWFMDEVFIGKTSSRHQLSIDASPGEYILSLTDNFGNRHRQKVTILSR